jgi:hypothetical protein
MTVLALQYARPRTFWIDTATAGDYGTLLTDPLRRANSSIGGAAQNWEPQIDAAIATIAAECSVANWDGDQAAAVSPEALRLAERVAQFFYCYVPRGTPAPEIIPESDGEVSLSWTRDPSRMFSVSIGNHNKLNYAGRLGGGVEPHDVASFDIHDPTTVQQMASYVSQLFK